MRQSGSRLPFAGITRIRFHGSAAYPCHPLSLLGSMPQASPLAPVAERTPTLQRTLLPQSTGPRTVGSPNRDATLPIVRTWVKELPKVFFKLPPSHHARILKTEIAHRDDVGNCPFKDYRSRTNRFPGSWRTSRLISKFNSVAATPPVVIPLRRIRSSNPKSSGPKR